ncbi:hypothetical protein [Fusibacter ferrireducens]|uniref:DUF4083 domain-containing protein n=1 Tax=Fusibacter ferrireducens TaxID=2785058 RepID=A0ABR9ZTN9_9FIRM|nr:hypothetical protein [Fusibacter ferrireducens]MBF4693815.1 hypothetical protein [Fusibacter ferrireducens]
MRLGLVAISWTFIFQLLNIVLILALFIGIPYFVYKKYKKLEKRLEIIEDDLKSISAKDE